MSTHQLLTILILLLTLITPLQSNDEHNLTCFATLSPYSKVICPKDRSNFCLKEYTNSSRQECGSSSHHPFDQWDIKEPGGLCVYRKCSASCPNETKTFIGRNGVINSRSSACCASDLCNEGYNRRRTLLIAISQIIIAYIFHKI